MEHAGVAVVRIELVKSRGELGERNDGIGLVAGVGHSSLGLNWDYTLTGSPCKHSRWGSQEVEGSHVLAPVHRIVCSSDEHGFAKKDGMSFVVVAFRDGGESDTIGNWRRCRWSVVQVLIPGLILKLGRYDILS